jgi:glutamate-1-semialdehyde 2,1-aminomutase
VVAAVVTAAERGLGFGAPTEGEVELAGMIVGALPGAEQVRLVSSGTEAVMTGLRLARAHTQRSRIVKFAGCYHGHSDGVLVQAGSGGLTFGVPDSAGVPEGVAALTAVAQYNDIDSVGAILESTGDVAAIIVEPVVGNMGTVAPEPGFLEGLRSLADAHGALLIFDEVITGFRVAWGGAQSRFGVVPDLTCLGKVVGGGLPLAAVAGRRDVMDQLTPGGPVYQAGTLSGNPLAVAAGLATLRLLAEAASYERLEQLGRAAEDTLRTGIARLGRPACLNRVGSMFTLFLGVEQVRDLRTALGADSGAYARFFHGMLEEGFYLPPSQFEASFISLAHTRDDVVHMAERAVACLAAAQ